MRQTNISRKRRLRNMIFISFCICMLLIVRIGFIQFVQGSELQAMAYMQQTLNRNINPKRGTIYDSSGKNALAISASCETVSINPTNISKENKEKVARALTDIFSLDYDTVYKKVSKNSSIETIVKKVEKTQTDKLRIWMTDNNITTGINIDEDTKRYYPYSTLASNVIGFTGSDNQGLEGLERYYEDILKGEQGKILKLTDARGGSIDNEGENYVPAVDGKDLILSIDLTIQSICEKYLEKACIDNECTDGGNVIAINPKTGDILALANYPSYDLNSPYTINNQDLANVWDSMQAQERSTALQQMWRNKGIADTYEPGSTFKILTTAAALEEGITQTDKAGEFVCTGSINIAGTRIKCWRHYRPHGAQSLREALMNSCNPVFIGLGQELGISKYYRYLDKFGLLGRTGIDMPGEAGSIFLKEEKAGPVELATISFGQRFEITPIQMLSILSTLSNGGIPTTPRLVKATVDSNTGERTDIEVKTKERVVSKETADNVLSMMESVVSEGTGRKAGVKGYSIGGKTGTSEDGVNTNRYVTSFIGVADTNDPEIAIVIVLYNPVGEGGHQGGAVAAPVAGEIFSEVLPYLEISKTDDEEPLETITMPNVTGLTYNDAKTELNDLGINYDITNEEFDENSIIIDQIPKKGIMINSGTKAILTIQ